MTPRGYWRDVAVPERRDMTVCIAAACDEDESNCIVLCSDWRVSGALGSAETMLKQKWLPKNWWLLVSGIESDINALTLALRAAFEDADTVDDRNAPSIVRDTLNARKKQNTLPDVQRLDLAYVSCAAGPARPDGELERKKKQTNL
jgi:hypothetical protein